MKKTTTTSSWDATLDTGSCDRYNNADLTITIRLGFRQINPAKGAATGTYNDYGAPSPSAMAKARKIVKWTPHAWLSWKQKFVRSAQNYWHGKFWLVNNQNEFEFEDGGVKYIPNIWCRFKLIESDYSPGGRYHHVIDVVNLDKSETWFGSHSTLYDNLDSTSVQKGTGSKGNPIMQRAHVHEIGHLLGLGHVDIGKPHCPNTGNTNAAVCYGITDADKNSVMGKGMQLRAKHGNPWRRGIIAITGKGSALTLSDWEAKMVRHYPRTHADVAANRHITTKPSRS